MDNPTPNEGWPCVINIEIDSDIQPPIYVYYQLDNFYQNHRRYVKSRSNKQLLGNLLTEEELTDDCSPIVLNRDIGRFVSVDKVTPLKMDEPAFPCGLVAKSLFNDTFSLAKTDGEEVVMTTTADEPAQAVKNFNNMQG